MAGFVCLYYGNTGSSWLLTTLGSSPQVLIPGFEPLEDWAWAAPIDDRFEWLEVALAPPAQRNGPEYEAWIEKLRTAPRIDQIPSKPAFEQVGIKLRDVAVADTERLAELLEKVGARAIILTRENRVKHALSMYRYMEEGKSQFDTGGDRSPTKLKMREFEIWVENSGLLHQEALRIRDLLRQRLGPGNVIDVAYEDFMSDEGKRDTIDRLGAFLGIEPIEPPASLELTKATPDDLRAAVSNYYTLRLRYAFTALRRDFRASR